LGKALVSAFSGKRAGEFKGSTREGAINDNAQKNGGTNKCEKCGQEIVRTPNKKGETPPKNQLHVHHDPAIKEGGGKDSNPVILCRECHQKMHHSKPKAEEPK
jgi:predicted HNH restriction endonuclease